MEHSIEWMTLKIFKARTPGMGIRIDIEVEIDPFVAEARFRQGKERMVDIDVAMGVFPVCESNRNRMEFKMACPIDILGKPGKEVRIIQDSLKTTRERIIPSPIAVG